jgi:hypothetical protein
MSSVFAVTEIFTPIIESAAAAIGAGILIGGFAGASNGARRGLSREQVERTALRDSYIGAAWTLALWALDRCIVYAT